LHRAQPGQLGRTVHLLQVDADRAKEAEHIDAKRCAAGIDDASAAQSELIAHRAVDKEFAETAQKTRPERDRPPLRDAELRPLRHLPEELEDAALCRAGIRGAHHDLGQRVLPLPRRRQRDRRPDLAHIAAQRLRLFREVDGEPDMHVHREREQRIANPGHRQVSDMLVTGAEAFRRGKHLGRVQQIGMRQHHALRARRRPRCVREQTQIIRLGGLDRRLDIARMRFAKAAAFRLHRLE